MSQYLIVIEPTETGFSAYVPDLPGCVATGKTVKETERRIQEAIEIHGEHIALTESIDFGSQPEDQAPFEKEVSAGAKICVRLFRMTADAGPTPMNTVCAESTAIKGNRLMLSPNAGYLLIDSKTSPLVIQSSYRKDEKGPAWLTNGADQ